jgi:hypothetical protein
MFLTLKIAAAGAAALLGGGTVADTCCTPPTEVISCQDGVSSWPPAACTQVDVAPNFTQVKLLCPPGEQAISGGFRSTLPGPGVTGRPRPPVQLAPVVPTGSHALGYVFAWRSAGASPVRVFVTCEPL